MSIKSCEYNNFCPNREACPNTRRNCELYSQYQKAEKEKKAIRADIYQGYLEDMLS